MAAWYIGSYARSIRGICLLTVLLLASFGLPSRGEEATGPEGATDEKASLGPETAPQAVEQVDGKTPFRVSAFTFEYAYDVDGQPPIEQAGDEICELPITLGMSAGGYVSPRDGYPEQTICLNDVPLLTVQLFYPSAINVICAQAVSYCNNLGFIGILVRTHPDDISPDAEMNDKRQDRTDLRLLIATARVGEVRTIASSGRTEDDSRINHPAYERIRGNSPLQTGAILKKDILDDYVFRLNRYPGRRVDASIASFGREGEVALDYLITEGRPLLVYFLLSNTGTEHTNVWRERLGLVKHQFTGRDDTLTFDYITAGFSASHAIVASYESPISAAAQKTRYRVYGA